MKRKLNKDDDLVTRGMLRAELDDQLKNYATKKDLLQFRSDMYTRFDDIVAKLDQIREEQLFITHDNRQLKKTDGDHEDRIKELEKQAHN